MISDLTRVGPNLPEKVTVGHWTPNQEDPAEQRQRTLSARVLRELFGRVVQYALDDISPVSFDDGVAVAAHALQNADLEVLGYIGLGGDYLAEKYRGREEDLLLLRKVLPSGDGNACLSNVDETGGYGQTNPVSGDLRELLLIFYDSASYAGLYWSEPID